MLCSSCMHECLYQSWSNCISLHIGFEDRLLWPSLCSDDCGCRRASGVGPPRRGIGRRKLYVKFYKWDSVLVHMMTGKPLYLTKAKSAESGSLDCELWDDLIKSRQEAANMVLTEAKNTDEGGEEGGKKKKAKLQRATSKSMLLLPETIEVTCRGYQLRMLLERTRQPSLLARSDPREPRVVLRECSIFCSQAEEAKVQVEEDQ